MRYLFFALLISAVTSEFASSIDHLVLKLKQSPHRTTSNVQEKWIEQPLDHFDSNEKGTYKMRYFENPEFWQPNAPIYIFIGGEGELRPVFVDNFDALLLIQIVKETKGALFATEHRYYGKSKPNISHDDLIQYYRFLNSRQALADLASFIKMLKLDQKYASSKVVVFGASYSGNLAVWMRELYPELVDAAVASSAPVLAKKDFHEYLDGVRYTLDTYGTPNCTKLIENTFRIYEELLKSAKGIETLKKELNICPDSDLTVLENQQVFFFTRYNFLKNRTQMSIGHLDIEKMCNKFPPGFNLSERCMPIDFYSRNWTHPWNYQTCTEFGYKQTTSSEKQPFVHWNPLSFLIKTCANLVKGDIEKRIDEGVAKTNEMYGGLSPNVSKVVFTHGDMDPWHTLGVLKDLGPDVPVIMNKGSSHCGILMNVDGEPEEMRESRKRVKELIKKWISTS